MLVRVCVSVCMHDYVHADTRQHIKNQMLSFCFIFFIFVEVMNFRVNKIEGIMPQEICSLFQDGNLTILKVECIVGCSCCIDRSEEYC